MIIENTLQTFLSVTCILNKMANKFKNLVSARLLDNRRSIQNVSRVAVLSCSYVKCIIAMLFDFM